MTNKRVLFVDDDKNFLSGIQRSLFRRFDICVASSPQEGLELLTQETFSVVISDMKMPEMTGIQFLTHIKNLYPDTVRVLYTGYADQQTAIDAVNQGEIFRFLTKPCSLELLIRVVQDAIRQYQLITSERELVEKTLLGAIDLLSQILSVKNPTAQGQAKRLKFYIHHLASALGYDDLWFYEMAAMLSRLGCLTIPAKLFDRYLAEEILSDDDMSLINGHPAVAEELLLNIPRMEDVAAAVALQNLPSSDFSEGVARHYSDRVKGAAQLLHVLNEYDHQLNIRHRTYGSLVKKLTANPLEYHPDMVTALELLQSLKVQYEPVSIGAMELTMQMQLAEDIFTNTGVKLAASGQELTDFLLIGIKNYAKKIGVKEPFTVLAPIDFVEKYQVRKGGGQ